MTVLTIQRRMMELGRVRLGEKSAKGQPVKLDSFRFTSASETLLNAVAELHGGKVRRWEGAPDEGYFEVYTEATELSILLPPVFSAVDGSPTTAYSQYYELWSGGGCQRRCDGVTEALSGKECLCDKDKRACKITTRVSFMLPEIPGLGVWRLESHGMNAAIELPGTLEVLVMAAAQRQFIPAVLRIEHRTKKVAGEKFPRRYTVPVIDLPGVRVADMLNGGAGEAPAVINAPAPKPPRAALPAAEALPEDAAFEREERPEFGPPPPLPASEPGVSHPVAPPGDGGPSAARSGAPPGSDDPLVSITAEQVARLDIVCDKLRKGGHVTTEQLILAAGGEPELIEKGGLDFAPHRDRLSQAAADSLIERLERYEAKVGAA